MDTIEFNDCAKMYSLMNASLFSEWLQSEMNKRNWSNAEMARQSGVTRGAIGNVLRGDRGVGRDLLVAIARGLNVPIERVFQEAGLEVPAHGYNPMVDELNHIANELSEDDLAELIELARIKSKRRKETRPATKKSSRSIRPARVAN